jgi:hypothetical protein
MVLTIPKEELIRILGEYFGEYGGVFHGKIIVDILPMPECTIIFEKEGDE